LLQKTMLRLLLFEMNHTIGLHIGLPLRYTIISVKVQWNLHQNVMSHFK